MEAHQPPKPEAASTTFVTTPSSERGTRQGPEAQRAHRHWLLATPGKRVLRPGGIGPTRCLLETVESTSADRVVELGPGVGGTAEILMAARPTSYKSVDPTLEGGGQVADVHGAHLQQTETEVEYIVADVAETGLSHASVDLVVGEAMLTIQSDDHKREIIAEIARLPALGGRHSIHELPLRAIGVVARMPGSPTEKTEKHDKNHDENTVTDQAPDMIGAARALLTARLLLHDGHCCIHPGPQWAGRRSRGRTVRATATSGSRT